MGTVCELHEEQLSVSDDNEEDHNTWNVLFDLFTSLDFGARIQLSLADEELGQVGCDGTVCVRSCTRYIVLDCSDECSFSVNYLFS